MYTLASYLEKRQKNKTWILWNERIPSFIFESYFATGQNFCNNT